MDFINRPEYIKYVLFNNTIRFIIQKWILDGTYPLLSAILTDIDRHFRYRHDLLR